LLEQSKKLNLVAYQEFFLKDTKDPSKYRKLALRATSTLTQSGRDRVLAIDLAIFSTPSEFPAPDFVLQFEEADASKFLDSVMPIDISRDRLIESENKRIPISLSLPLKRNLGLLTIRPMYVQVSIKGEERKEKQTQVPLNSFLP